MANKGGHLMSKETWNVLHSKPKKSLFFNTPGTYSILHANLYKNYSVVKDSNVVIGFIFSIVQNWPTIKAVCTKLPEFFLHFLQYFNISERHYSCFFEY